MSNTSNFRQAIREASSQSIIGPNVVSKALPFVGGGLVLTAVGAYGGLGVMNSNPDLFMSTFIAAIIAQLVLFFIASNVAQKGNNSVALPLLTLYSLLTGYTLSGIIAVALGTPGVGIQGMAIAALGCGLTFVVARQIGSNLSDRDGLPLAQTLQMALMAFLVVIVLQFVFAVFLHTGTPTWLEIAISGFGVFLFAGIAVVDFYLLPRTYPDDRYLPAALSMYLTYINLFIFILRLLIALNSRD